MERNLQQDIVSETLALRYRGGRDDSFRRQAQMGELGAYLTERWKARFPDAKTWIMWDVALIEGLIRPELASEEQVITPPENRQRKVRMYHRIDADRMRVDFWKAAMPASRVQK